ncbi:hypothetical protein C8R46DRAFT_1007296 [Mycena filopes]|nr:hypothetical protein C8R46DRAFT_1007296 [Mycena filopes]
MSLSIGEINTLLPPYAPSTVVPSYSPEPGVDERVLQETPRMNSRIFSGTYTKKSRRATVVLSAQDETADAPTYGRSALIDGAVSLEQRESVSKVTLEIKGTIEFMVAGTIVSQSVVDAHSVLWSMEHSAGAACPSSVPLAARLPAQFTHNGATPPLPPSYSASYDDRTYIKIFYSLAVTVSRARGRRLAFLGGRHTISIPFNYCPRTRPGHPIVAPAATDFLTDVKTMPEEFHALTLIVAPRFDALVALQPVHIQLFTPSTPVFPLATPTGIPVHVQLTGPPASLRPFLSNSSNAVTVRLLRQTTFLVDGHAESRCQIPIGTATLTAVPPPISAQASSHSSGGGGETSLDWAGVLHCDAAVTVGSFDAGVVRVQDFIVLDVLSPGSAKKSPFAPARQFRAVRLVTDPWPDT